MAKEKDSTLEPVKQIVITPEDCEAAFEFWDHFQIPKIPELDTALAAFKTDPSYENQQKILMAVTKAIAFTDHDAFKDEIFTNILPECRNTFNNLAFDEEMKKILSEDK